MASLQDNFMDKFQDYVPNFRQIRLILLLIFSLTMPLVIYLGNTEYGYTKTIYTFIYISFLLLLWLGELLVNEEKEFALTSLSAPIGMLLLAGVLSTINAASKGVVLQSLALLIYFYLIYLLVANTIKTESEAKYLLLALITSGAGATIYGTLQYFGLAKGAEGLKAAPSNIISVLGNQNYLGGFISYLFIPALALIILANSKTLRLYLISTLGLFFFILYPIGARGAWLGLIMGFVVFVSLFFYFKPIKNRQRVKVTLLLIILVLLLAYLFASAPGPLNSVLTYSAPEGNDASWGVFTPVVQPIVKQLLEKSPTRVEDWYIGWEMFKDHPIVGIGLGNYKINFLDYRAKFLNTTSGSQFGEPIPRAAQAHNEYVQFAAELGIFGIITILASLGFLVKNLFTRVARSRDKRIQLLGIGLIAGITGFLVHSMVSFPAHLPASSYALVVFIGLINSAAFGKPDYQLNPSRLSRYLVFGILAVLAISVSVFAYRDWRANILMGKGKNQVQYGNYRIAKDQLQKSIKLDFRPRHTYYYLGVAERELGNDKKALEYFEKSRGQFEPYNLWLQLGTLYLREGKVDRAKANLKKFISTGPEDSLKAQAKYFLATINARNGELNEAQKKLSEVLAIVPDYDRAIILQGDIARSRENWSKARQKWNKALDTINEKIEEIEHRLSGQTKLENYGELKSKRESLKKRRKSLKEKLDRF